MRICERQFGAARVFDFQGPLVGADVRRIVKEALEPRDEAGPELVVVNLARVADLDCDGMSALGLAERALRRKGGALRVALPNDGKRPLMNRRVRTFFDAFDSVEDALADLRAAMAVSAGRRRSWWRAAMRPLGWWQTLRPGRRPEPGTDERPRR